MPNPYGQTVRSVEGLTLGTWWALQFENNEVAASEGKWDDVATDVELVERLCASFPERAAWSRGARNVVSWRQRFNRGDLPVQPAAQPAASYEKVQNLIIERRNGKTIVHKLPTKPNLQQ